MATTLLVISSGVVLIEEIQVSGRWGPLCRVHSTRRSPTTDRIYPWVIVAVLCELVARTKSRCRLARRTSSQNNESLSESEALRSNQIIGVGQVGGDHKCGIRIPKAARCITYKTDIMTPGA